MNCSPPISPTNKCEPVNLPPVDSYIIMPAKRPIPSRPAAASTGPARKKNPSRPRPAKNDGPTPDKPATPNSPHSQPPVDIAADKITES